MASEKNVDELAAARVKWGEGRNGIHGRARDINTRRNQCCDDT